MIDLFCGYFQCKLTPDSSKYYAFQVDAGVHAGVYAFTRLVQGDQSSPAVFQYLMDLVLAGLLHKQCIVYLDDVATYATTLDELFERMQTLFNRLRGAKLRIHASKCQFATDTAKFLGFVFHRGTVTPDEAKIRIVKDYPRPTTVKRLRAYLGLTSWFRAYIRNYSKISEPLRQLVKQGTAFKWTDRCEQSFLT